MPANRRGKCDRCNKVKNDLELCGDDCLCRNCEVQNAADLVKLKFSNITPSMSSDDGGEAANALAVSHDAPPCTVCAPQFAKLQRQIADLWDAHKKLMAEVAEMKQTADSLKQFTAKADENDKITEEISQMKAAVSRLTQVRHTPHSVDQLGPRDESNSGSSILVSLHAEFADIRRRSSNVIVSGLKPVVGEDDCNLFSALCEENLSIKPAVIREKCKRIGKEKPDKPRLYLVALRSEDSAKELLRAACQLRKSTDNYTRENIFINADLTRAEAQFAYEQRVARRLQRSTTGSRPPGHIPNPVPAAPHTHDVASSLSAGAAPFQPVPFKTSDSATNFIHGQQSCV